MTYRISLMNPDSQTILVDALYFERELWTSGFRLVAGVDEAGRGCLSGPVVAAAVVFPPELILPGVDDSKKLSASAREQARARILESSIAHGIGLCSPHEIDELNILWAAMEAMKRAVEALQTGPDFLLIDGNRCFPDSQWPLRTIVNGDARSHTIAAASILAKTHRDQLMLELDKEYPGYGWASNKGYPTKEHYAGLASLGSTPHHRMSFRLG
jgi:ribonuclease HII